MTPGEISGLRGLDPETEQMLGFLDDRDDDLCTDAATEIRSLLNALDALHAKIAELEGERDRYATALRLIEKAEKEVFDEDDLEEWVTISMDMDEASRIATVALLGCTCMEVFGENPDCPAHGRDTEWSNLNG